MERATARRAAVRSRCFAPAWARSTAGAATGQMLTGGSVPKAKSVVTVKIGGQTATVTFAGAIPYGSPGLYQVIATVPSGLAAGPQPVLVAAGSGSSVSGVTMVVK